MAISCNNWHELTSYLKSRYDLNGNINHILFFIGIQESGKGLRNFSREDKVSLILLGQKVVMDNYASDTNLPNEKYNKLPEEKILTEHLYEKKLKHAILSYFNDH